MADRISVIVPTNPFTPPDVKEVQHFLCAMPVEKLMEWWPGKPHEPKKNIDKVKAIQRSLDWKRVAQIAAYLLQREVEGVGVLLDEIFSPIYEPRSNEPGREWPPPIKGAIKYTKSSFPFFSNVLIHVNGAIFEPSEKTTNETETLDKATNENGTLDRTTNKTGTLHIDSTKEDFYLTVIDGQHRINGAYFALKILQKEKQVPDWLIPAEVFLNLDKPNHPARQAQIFIDVNLNQKKVDRSLVADLFPLARGKRDSYDTKDRAQDIGRRLMLEVGPLVGMIQIPGIRYGLKDVVALATLNSAIEGAIPALENCDITNLEAQTNFLSQILDCWLVATGRMEAPGVTVLDKDSVVYQGRVLVTVISLVPAILRYLKSIKQPIISDLARDETIKWFKKVMLRAGLLKSNKFISKEDFKKHGFLGSGGIGRFKNLLWAASLEKTKLSPRTSDKKVTVLAEKAHQLVFKSLGTKK